MKRIRSIVLCAAALLLAAGLWFGSAGTAKAAPDTVSSASELADALAAAETAGTSVTIAFSPGAAITVSGPLTIPANVTLDLSGGSLIVSSGTVLVNGAIVNGAADVAGGTLVRAAGCGIAATLTASGGAVRGARSLTLENLDPLSAETVVSITYAGASDADKSGFVTLPANGVLYPLMTGSNYASFRAIESVTTTAAVYRLGTRNAGTLSREYAISYDGVSGATFKAANPASYTASDAAVTLNSPAREGYTFAGWTCAALSITTPVPTAVIPEGTVGALVFTANWTPAQGGFGGGSGGLSSQGAASDADDSEAKTQPEATAAPTDESAQATPRIGRGTSSTKVTFSSDVDAMLPALEITSAPAFPWGWIALGVLGAAILIYLIAYLRLLFLKEK